MEGNSSSISTSAGSVLPSSLCKGRNVEQHCVPMSRGSSGGNAGLGESLTAIPSLLLVKSTLKKAKLHANLAALLKYCPS